MATASLFAETYRDAPKCQGERLCCEDIVFVGSRGDFTVTLETSKGVGLADFAIITHVNFDDAFDLANALHWAI